MPGITHVDARADFESGFQRSKRGNLWRNYAGVTVTIFQRKGDGFFAWCIADSGGTKRFSSGGYESEESALSALWCELGEGEG